MFFEPGTQQGDRQLWSPCQEILWVLGCLPVCLSVCQETSLSTAQPSPGNCWQLFLNVPVNCSGCSFLYVPEHCKKRHPKPLSSLPGIPHPGPHLGGCLVVEGHVVLLSSH